MGSFALVKEFARAATYIIYLKLREGQCLRVRKFSTALKYIIGAMVGGGGADDLKIRVLPRRTIRSTTATMLR